MMKYMGVLATILLAVLCISGLSFAGTYSGGAGTAASPYQIANSTDWQELMATDTDWDEHFQLTSHLDLAGVTLTPVGNLTTKFTGTFDAAGYTIYNAAMDLPDENYIGLFGYTWPPAIIRNVRLENAEITGRYWVGGLVGRTNGTTIENAAFNGTVSGVANVGGIAGLVTGATDTLLRCYSTGTVTGSRYVGGLVGYIWGATLENCYTHASVVGVADGLGGDYEDFGGLIGRTYQTSGNLNVVHACYAAGSMILADNPQDVGGLVGDHQAGTFTNCFWDTQISGQHTSPVGLGKTTAQMKRRETFTSAGWDFVGVWGDGQSQTYPYLRLRPASDIDGDSRVRFEDVAILAAQWLTETPFITDYDGIEWVIISDPGFVGQISKHETTNAQFAQYLNAALASGDIEVDGSYVRGSSGPYSGQNYYRLDGQGSSSYGATHGGAARINWSGSAFTVDAGFENHPVTYVSWYGATAFADFYGWWLPTEDEWQAVADYDGTYTYGCGLSINNAISNYRDSYHPHGTTQVGIFGAYGYGMADMSGNVWEWTSTPESGTYVIRGGSWFDTTSYCTVSYRYYIGAADAMTGSRGFRVCRDLMAEPDITWVTIDDPGVPEHEAFSGEMSKYETTNAQFCQYLNTALFAGQIEVDGDYVISVEDFGPPTGQLALYYLEGTGADTNGATAGGKARINWSGDAFTVDPGFEDHPVTYVMWYGAFAFAQYYGWRLPTEWEWQAVADFDGSYYFGCGTTIANDRANYWNSTHPHGTTPVGAFGTYGYGMADMAGNVSEWTSSGGIPFSPIIRGGGWNYGDYGCQVSVRGSYDPYSMSEYSSIGFRVCR